MKIKVIKASNKAGFFSHSCAGIRFRSLTPLYKYIDKEGYFVYNNEKVNTKLLSKWIDNFPKHKFLRVSEHGLLSGNKLNIYTNKVILFQALFIYNYIQENGKPVLERKISIIDCN